MYFLKFFYFHIEVLELDDPSVTLEAKYEMRSTTNVGTVTVQLEVAPSPTRVAAPYTAAMAARNDAF